MNILKHVKLFIISKILLLINYIHRNLTNILAFQPVIESAISPTIRYFVLSNFPLKTVEIHHQKHNSK